MTGHYDVIIVGSGAGGGTPAHPLASSTYYVFRKRVSASDFQPAPEPGTPPGAGGPTATPEVTHPPSRHGT